MFLTNFNMHVQHQSCDNDFRSHYLCWGGAWTGTRFLIYFTLCQQSLAHFQVCLSISFWLWQCLVFVCRVNTGLWAQGPGASDNFIVDHCLKCIKLLSVWLLYILFSTFLIPKLLIVHNNIPKPDTKLNCSRADPRLLGALRKTVSTGGNTHLSVFHSALDRARETASLPQLAMLSTCFFLSRARDFTKFTLHDLTVFHVERATAPHYNKWSFMFS